MIEIIFIILKIIGIILLSIVSILIMSLLIILFHPIRYAISAEVHNSKESIESSGQCSWLLGLVKVKFSFHYPEFQWNGRVFFIKLNGDPKRSKSKKNKKKATTQDYKEDKTEDVVGSEEIADLVEDAALLEDVTLLEDISGDEQAKHKKNRKKKKKISILQKIKFTIIRIYDSIKLMQERKEKLVDFLYDDTHQYAFEKCKRKILYLMKKYKPKKLSLVGCIGFDDPSLTGKMLAVLSVLYPIYGDTLEITPDFEEQVVDGGVVVTGKVRIYPLVKIGLSLVSDKKVRKTVYDMKNIELK